MTRSNRTLTQFAVDRLSDFIKNPSAFVSETKGNTEVSVHVDSLTKELTFQVLLFEQSIFELSERCLIVRNGGFFDSKGRPSRTTRERLNGLLDAAGELGCIPEGVRVFFRIEGDQFSCKIGKGETVNTFDSASPDRIIVRNPDQLLVL